MSFSCIKDELREINSKRTPVPMRVLHVKVGVKGLKQFNHAFVTEGLRKNPLKAKMENLTEDELYRYECFLLKHRVDLVNGECAIFRMLQRLSMPCFVEKCLSDVGRVVIRDRALDIRPVVDDDIVKDLMDLQEAIEISNKIEAFKDDLAVATEGMPKNESGAVETMTLCLMQGYVVGMGDYDDPLVEYLVYALQCMLIETEYNSLYYMTYDDVRTIEANISVLGRSLVV